MTSGYSNICEQLSEKRCRRLDRHVAEYNCLPPVRGFDRGSSEFHIRPVQSTDDVFQLLCVPARSLYAQALCK